MRACSLLCVCIVAKVCVLAGRELPVTFWTPFAYLWQDFLLVGIFGLVDALLRRPRIGWTLYTLFAGYIALNVPIARVLSTPLTWPLLRAAGGPLTDSIAYHATAMNLILLGVVLAVAGLAPWILRRVSSRRLAVMLVLIVPPMVVLGPIAESKVDTRGLHRNPLVALVTTAMPRVPSVAGSEDWRASPMPAEREPDPQEDLTALRGKAAGYNIVVIVLESAGQVYWKPGTADDPMPHLSKLATKSIRFDNAYATYPESIKGLFSVLCSTYPAMDTRAEEYAALRTPSMAEVVKGNGYRTGLFHSGRFRYLGMESIIGNRGFDVLEDAGAIGGDHESSFGIDEGTTVKRMLGWIDDGGRDRPFFLMYLPIAGHHPYIVKDPGPFPTREEIDRYRNALHYADRSMHDLIQGIGERGLEKKTLFVIFGDHGEAFFQHPDNYGHTLFIHEENVRVPYLIHAPGLIDGPRRIGRPASLADTAPTVLDLLGMTPPSEYQGVSLLANEPRMALFMTDYSLGFVGLRDGHWKFIHQIEADRSQLYDLDADPEEKSNRAGEFPERVDAYRRHLLKWSAAEREYATRKR